MLALAVRVRFQDQRQRGPEGLFAARPRGRMKANAPYEFGCKVSVVTPVTKPKGGQIVLHAKALHGNPFDGHTLGPVIAELEALTGVETRRIRVDKGYRGHNHAQKFRVWISGQVRRVTAPIRREMRRRAAVEPVIGRIKAERRIGRNYLKGATAIASIPCLPRPATTSACSCAGSGGFCAPSSGRYSPPRATPNRLKNPHQRFFTDDLLLS
jgi:transposase, IS5 family